MTNPRPSAPSSRPCTIRPARMADLERLVELLLDLQDTLEGSNPELWRMNAQARSDLKGQVANRLQAANSCALVAEDPETGIVGLILGRVIVNNRYVPPRAGQIDQTFVRADRRRMGVGSRLVAEMCRFFAAEGVEDITLRYVVGNQEAEAFWSALGFRPRITVVGASRQDVERQAERISEP